MSQKNSEGAEHGRRDEEVDESHVQFILLKLGARAERCLDLLDPYLIRSFFSPP